MKYLKLLVLSILQYLFIFVLLYAYNQRFEIRGTKLSINLSSSYYLIAVLPITIIIWNILFVSIKNIKIQKRLLCIPLSVIVLYWISSISTYPYRVSFLILMSIAILAIGNTAINKYILKKKGNASNKEKFS